MRRFVQRVFGGMALLAFAGCAGEKERGASELPANQPVSGVVKLSEKAQQQLGLEWQKPAKRTVRAVMSLTGWLELPPGREIVVKSPLTGYLAARDEQPAWALGATVQQRQTLQRVMAFLSPAELAQLVAAKEEADISIEQSLVSMTLAEEQLAKASAARDAISGTRLNELKEILGRSKAAYKESKEKLPFLPREPYDGELLMRPVAVESPLGGRITAIHVSEPQFVFLGDPLWTVADWSALWVRVPVFETDLSRVLAMSPANVAVPGRSAIAAEAVKAPQATQARLRTVDLLYLLPNPDEALRPGQSVSVAIPAGMSEQRLLVARSALLWDGHGSAWVYVRVDGGTFRRQLVELGQTDGDDIVIARGLDANDEVVTTAAQALYGEEFKGSMPAEDEE